MRAVFNVENSICNLAKLRLDCLANVSSLVDLLSRSKLPKIELETYILAHCVILKTIITLNI